MSSIWAKQTIRKHSRSIFVFIIFLLMPLVYSCDASRPKSYITPRVIFNKTSAEMGTPVEVTYSFDTSDDFPGLKKDLTVFVHFLDPSKRIRFVDDHNPTIRTNQWGPEQNYSYTRTYFLPENIPAGKYIVELGMYTPSGKGERFVLNAKQLSERSYEVGNINIEKPSTGAEGQLISGWYDLEREPNNDWYHWRWIGKTAIAKLPNPRANSILYLKAESEPQRFQSEQNISIYVNGNQLDRFSVESAEPFVQKYKIDAASLGTNNSVEVKLEVDQTFVPSANDQRELGLRVYCLYLGNEQELTTKGTK
jgi:hypothetical protein